MDTPFEPHWEAEREDFFAHLDLSAIKTPAYLIHLTPLEENLQILHKVKEQTGCKVLLALKGFAAWKTFDLIAHYLDGACASSVNEARLAKELIGKEVHTFAPAYSLEEFPKLLALSDHIIFNSFNQWRQFKPAVLAHNAKADPSNRIACGIRINPEIALDVPAELYAPTAKGSRMGVTYSAFVENLEELQGLKTLHFHTLCEQGVDALEATLQAVEAKFGPYIGQMESVNFGGGHHITRQDYDISKLCALIVAFQNKYGVQVILEPGEAVALNCGVLIATVLDIIDNDGKIAILDASAEAHTPDVLSMPYRPSIVGAGAPGEKAYTYRLGATTCLAGDFFGSYSFDTPLEQGSKIVMQNMAIYTMVKNTTFNGVPLPDILIMDSHNRIVHRKSFSYSDYKDRLC
jgi:carboxynorspermidine decarboxylase